MWLSRHTGAANPAEELVEQAAWSVDLAHAGYLARMKQGPDKSDFADARMLADLHRSGPGAAASPWSFWGR
ncbi:MAG: hypothetical protein IID40_12250 [Planctomycetes bacterium]|nr:hypothetical protein [Planctomycetota bacterium]